ncbi:hypothetical protein HDU96_000626 [Phlyctochytrium bullatum]|nr:hypothetical protein HDU96_000626 [Phlyctochytrium bullatum]
MASQDQDMVIIKSVYKSGGDSLRRLTLKTKPPPTFEELEARLSNLHRISGPFVVTYTDSEGDAVAIDTTRELLDVLRGLKGNSLKLVLADKAPCEDDFELLHADSSASSLASEPVGVSDTASPSTENVDVKSDVGTSVLSQETAGTADVAVIEAPYVPAEAPADVTTIKVPHVSAEAVTENQLPDIESEPSKKQSWADMVTKNLPKEDIKVGISELCDMESSQRWVYSRVEDKDSSSASSSKSEARQDTVGEESGRDEVSQFIEEVQPLVKALVDRIENKPHLIPHLTKLFPQTLAGFDFGLFTFDEPARPRQNVHAHPPKDCSHESSNATQSRALITVRLTLRVRLTFEDLCAACFHKADKVHDPTHHFYELSNQKQVHRYVTCDGCGRKSFAGSRFKCADCPDYDLCQRCITAAQVLHVPGHWFNRIDAQPARRVRAAPDNAAPPTAHQMVLTQMCTLPSVDPPTLPGSFPTESANLENVARVNEWQEVRKGKPKASPEPPMDGTDPMTTASTSVSRPSSSVVEHAPEDPMKLLWDMGFHDRAVNERLLRRYPGNIDKVAEILLRKAGSLDDDDDEDDEF